MSDMLEEALAEFDRHLGGGTPTPEDLEDTGATEGAGNTPSGETEPNEPTETVEATEPTEATEAAEGRPRDEKGRFAKKQQEAPEAPGEPSGEKAGEETGEETGTEAMERTREQLLAGKFKTVEDLEKSYRELEQEFSSRNRDWHELKQLREEFAGFQKQTEQQLQQQLQQHEVAAAAPQYVQNLLDDERYYEAAEFARQSGNGILLGQVVDAWKDADPFGASSYNTALLIQQRDEEWEKRLASIQAETQPIVARQGIQAAFEEFSKDKPDIDQVAEGMLQVAQESPRIVASLEDGDPETQKQVLDYLYVKAKTRVSSTLDEAARAAQTAQRKEEAEVKKQAHVASTSHRAETEDTRTPEEQWLEEVFDPVAARYYGPE